MKGINSFNGLKNVFGVVGAVVVGLGVILNLSGGSNEQKVEHRGVVTGVHSVNNQGFTTEVKVFEMEPAFQQTLASKEQAIEATVVSSNKTLVEVQDNSTGIVYRINETKVYPPNPKVGQIVKADVIIKDSKTVLIQGNKPHQVGDTLTFRDKLDSATTVGQKVIDGVTYPIFRLDVPVNTVEYEEDLSGIFIYVSNSKAFTLSFCAGNYYLYPTGRTHHTDGVFKVNEDSDKLIPQSSSAISDAPCTKQDGYKYKNGAQLFQGHPITPSNKGIQFLGYLGFAFFALILVTSGAWIEGLQLLFSSKVSK
jgi:hypothetical protein